MVDEVNEILESELVVDFVIVILIGKVNLFYEECIKI